jgi:hypothetical protein
VAYAARAIPFSATEQGRGGIRVPSEGKGGHGWRKKNEERLRRGGEGESPGHKLLALAVKGMGWDQLLDASSSASRNVQLADRRQGPRQQQQVPFLDAKRHRRSQGPSAAGRP